MGGGKQCEGIYWGTEKWLRDHNFSWFPDSVFTARPWPIGKPEEHRSVKLTAQITSQVQLKPDHRAPICQASAVYKAQILVKNNPEPNEFIVKIFLRYGTELKQPSIFPSKAHTDKLMSRIPNIPLKPKQRYVDKNDLNSRGPPITESHSSHGVNINRCAQYEQEVFTLEHLTQSKCPSTPKHIDDFRREQANPWVKDGFLCFVVMTKLPGIRVRDIWEFDPETKEQRVEQQRIQRAFKDALL
jgi:hypothetical protein